MTVYSISICIDCGVKIKVCFIKVCFIKYFDRDLNKNRKDFKDFNWIDDGGCK